MSTESKPRVITCSVCKGAGHNKRTCPTTTQLKLVRVAKEAPEPTPTPEPAPLPPRNETVFMPPLPPPLPASETSSTTSGSTGRHVECLEFVFNRIGPRSFSSIWGLLRKCYNEDPSAFSIVMLPHISKADAGEHITVRHSHPFTVTMRDGSEKSIAAQTYYHFNFRDVITKSGGTKRIWTNITCLDAFKKQVVIASWC